MLNSMLVRFGTADASHEDQSAQGRDPNHRCETNGRGDTEGCARDQQHQHTARNAERQHREHGQRVAYGIKRDVQ